MDRNRNIEQSGNGSPNTSNGGHKPPTLPASARLPVNRCNLPAVILGSLTYQRHPVPLEIDGIHHFHGDLFNTLATFPHHAERAQRFQDYMTVNFLLDELDEAGLMPGRGRKSRANANYLRQVRGWSFDSDGREGAVLKRWVESRFGLLARHHAGSLADRNSEVYQRYISDGSRGLYATNALESQLDLLYTYCQYELKREYPEQTHLTLYRGINRMDEHEVQSSCASDQQCVLLNNLNSFTNTRDRADEFGDYILEAQIPLPKILFYNRLLPGMLKGENEYVVIGGVYEVRIRTL